MTRPPPSSALTTPHPLLKPGESITGTLERLAAENDRLRAEKTEMADAILQIGGLSEAHFRKNYENSYERMWVEIARADRRRDEALKIVDAARDLVIALEHDFGAGTTVASIQTHDAFNKLRSRMADL